MRTPPPMIPEEVDVLSQALAVCKEKKIRVVPISFVD